MKSLMFEGGEDGLFGELNIFNQHSQQTQNGVPVIWMLRTACGHGMNVCGLFSPGSTECWMIGLEQIRDHQHPEVAFPTWRTMWFSSFKCIWSPQLLVEAPDDITMELYTRD